MQVCQPGSFWSCFVKQFFVCNILLATCFCFDIQVHHCLSLDVGDVACGKRSLSCWWGCLSWSRCAFWLSYGGSCGGICQLVLLWALCWLVGCTVVCFAFWISSLFCSTNWLVGVCNPCSRSCFLFFIIAVVLGFSRWSHFCHSNALFVAAIAFNLFALWNLIIFVTNVCDSHSKVVGFPVLGYPLVCFVVSSL